MKAFLSETPFHVHRFYQTVSIGCCIFPALSYFSSTHTLPLITYIHTYIYVNICHCVGKCRHSLASGETRTNVSHGIPLHIPFRQRRHQPRQHSPKHSTDLYSFILRDSINNLITFSKRFIVKRDAASSSGIVSPCRGISI